MNSTRRLNQEKDLEIKFEKGSTPCQPDCWFSGIYKIVRYKNHERGPRFIYYAYYKPDGWKNWGNHVNENMPEK